MRDVVLLADDGVKEVFLVLPLLRGVGVLEP